MDKLESEGKLAQPLIVSKERSEGVPKSPPSIKRSLGQQVNLAELGIELAACCKLPVAKEVLVVPRKSGDRKKLEEAIKAKGFAMRAPKGMSRPLLVKIYRVDKEIEKDSLGKSIWNQNPELHKLVTEGEWKEQIPDLAILRTDEVSRPYVVSRYYSCSILINCVGLPMQYHFQSLQLTSFKTLMGIVQYHLKVAKTVS
ncbi:hypothetical protein GE061_001055 [Apolygus lucorum]|uniref:Uncharacterized protein n=1 Tax=Apolygus lucorum TaxID=248454 RepID=A0A8S9Y7K0_APOLU|nr:hypothetical protein GE061_001055 [Apolygus lucorum]